jgi:hypothetical protein
VDFSAMQATGATVRRVQRIQNVQERKRHFKKRYTQILKLLNLWGNQLISLLAAFVFVPSVLREKFQKLLAGK